MGKGKADDDDLDLDLTEEEQEALDEQEAEAKDAAAKAGNDDDETTAAKASAEDDDDADADDDADDDKKSEKAEDDDETAAHAAADKDASDDDKAAEPDKDEDEVKETKTERSAPSPQWEAPEDAEAKLKDIAEKKGELADKFDNGDLTAREYQTELDTLSKEERKIERDLDKAQMARDMRESTWFQQTVPAFLAEHTQYEENETLSAMLDAEVRRQQTAAHKAGEDPLSPTILAKAHKEIVKAVSGLTGKAAEDDDDAEDVKTAADKAAKAAGKRKAPPKTLAKVPASDAEDTDDGGKFASLDRLADKDPIAFEDAFARLPEHEQEAYLAQQ